MEQREVLTVHALSVLSWSVQIAIFYAFMNKRDREVFMIYDVHFKGLINIGILLSQCLLLDSQF